MLLTVTVILAPRTREGGEGNFEFTYSKSHVFLLKFNIFQI